ncbi:MAG: hypothetical protein J6X30_03530 [Clostridia bacterium]|nr:hypothetical protein [Clostridia bacterium]
MNNVVNDLLDQLENALSQTKKGLFSEKSAVDADACLEILDELRESLPTELERASNIMKERRQILIDAEEEAKQCIAAAQKNAEEMVAEHEITRQAENEAKQIVDLARQNAREVKLSARNYAVGVLDELNARVKDLQEQIAQDTADFIPEKKD